MNQYDATKLSETKDMDIEAGNYVVPPDVLACSRVEIEGVFKDTWESKQNIPFNDWKIIDDYIDRNLSDEAIVERLTK